VTPLWYSLIIAAGVTALGIFIGWPAGVGCALYWFRGRTALLFLLIVPLIMPSFLGAIGLSMVRTGFALPDVAPFSGLSGCIWSQSGMAVGLAAFAALVMLRSITESQANAVRLAGDERLLWRQGLKRALPASLASSALGGVLTLGDSGSGVLLGVRTAAGEILTAFAARYDLHEASRLCMSLAAVGLVITLPLLRAALLTVQPLVAGRDPAGRLMPRTWRAPLRLALLFTVVAIISLAPPVGLVLPVLRNADFSRAWSVIVRTGADTVIYAAGAACVSVVVACVLTAWVGQRLWRQRFVLAGLFVSLAIPPAWPALGWLNLSNHTPESLDWLMRGKAAVCIILGFRFLPVAFVLLLRRWNSFAPSWRMAARLHGVPKTVFYHRVLLPYLRPGLAVAGLLVAVFASGEVTIPLLLHPPDAQSVPLAIFTIMANAPEGFVATLCLCYIAAVIAILAAAHSFRRRL
jgi:iron(III) transport system permease protein